MTASAKFLGVSLLGIVCLIGAPLQAATLPVTSGLQLWLNAADINGADNAGLVDGSPVGSWVNTAPGASDSATNSGSARPTFVANGFNGKPVVRFDGINDLLFDSEPGLNISGAGAGSTIFLLMRQSSVATDGYFGNYGGSNTGYYVNESSDGFKFFAGAVVTDGAGTAAPTLNQPLILGAVKDASSMSLYVNGLL